MWEVVVISGGLAGGGISLLAGQRKLTAEDAESAEA